MEQANLHIKKLENLYVGEAVVFIGDDPFARDSWATKVQKIRSIRGENLLVGCEGDDTHQESRHFENFRLATGEESATGLVSETVQAKYVFKGEDEDDDADVEDQENDDEFPDFETEQEFEEAEKRAAESTETETVPKDGVDESGPELANVRYNDWAYNGMTNSIVQDTKVVVLEGCEDEVNEIFGKEFGTDVHRVIRHNTETDMITIMGVQYPAKYFRYATTNEIKAFGRDADLSVSGERCIRDTLKQICLVQARMDEQPLTDKNFPLWVRACLAQEYQEAIDHAGEQVLQHFDNEVKILENLSANNKPNAFVNFVDTQPLVPLLKHFIRRLGLEFHSGHTVSYHIHVIKKVVGMVYQQLQSRPLSKSSFEMFQKAELDMYGGFENFTNLYKEMDAFALVFAQADLDTLTPSTFELTLHQLDVLLNITSHVLLAYPLSELTLEEGEWELRHVDETTGHYSYGNKRYARVSRDRNEDGSVEVITELDSVTFSGDFKMEALFSSPNSIVVHPNVPFMPNKDIYVFVDDKHQVVLPEFQAYRLTAGKSVIVKYDGTPYVYQGRNAFDSSMINLAEQATGREKVIPLSDMYVVHTLSKDRLFSVQRNPQGIGVPQEDLKYPMYHAIYNDGKPQ